MTSKLVPDSRPGTVHPLQLKARQRWLGLAARAALTAGAAVGAGTALAATAGAAAPGSPADPRPNILLILADDLGYSDLGCFGSEISTPNLDALAARGIRFSEFYTTPKCFPSRASILTGLYPHETGMGEKPKAGLKHGATIADVLRLAGYHTWLSGKWHDKGDLPIQRGFDHSYGLCDGATNYFNPGNQRPGEPVPAEDHAPRKWAIDGKVYLPYTPSDPKFYTTDAFTDQAIRYLRSDKDGRPFFLYLAYNAPHYPLQAWPEDIAKYRDQYLAGWDRIRLARYERQVEMGLIDPGWVLSPRSRVPEHLHRSVSRWEPRFWDDDANVLPWDRVADHDGWDLKMAVYAAMVDRMDRDIGRVLATLKELGKEHNTLIIFLSDNGGSAGSLHFGANVRLPAETPPGPMNSFHTIDGPWADVNNTPFRYYKDTTFEGGISTPTIMCWPDGIVRPGRIVHQLADIMDLMPTCIDAAHAAYPATIRGQPVPPMEGSSLLPILRGGTRPPPASLFWEYHGNRAVRHGPWKLVAFPNQPWELYNMVDDRTELYNLAAVRPDVVAKLEALYAAWARRVGVKPNAANLKEEDE